MLTSGIARSAPPVAWHVLLLALAVVATSGCGGRAARPVRVDWTMGRIAPAFDPDGPYDAARVALERLTTRALVRLDSAGAVVPDAADHWTWSRDSLTLTFTLRPGLRFTDGVACSSAHFARALTAGLGRSDHATRAWALATVRGVSAVRTGRARPALGIATPDAATLRLELVRRDRRLLERIAATSASEAWRDRSAATWSAAVGLGPMRPLPGSNDQHLLLVRTADTRGYPDTLFVRFAIGDGRSRAALRFGTPDLIWPLPPGLRGEPVPRAYRIASDSTGPSRVLTLFMRADLPPTTKVAARNALAHGINRAEILRLLEAPVHAPGALIAGAPPFESPGYDLREMHAWMDKGRLGLSFHVTLAFDADGAGATIARAMQGEWSRSGLYVDLLPLRGAEWSKECLRGNRAHLLLVEWTPPAAGAGPALASLGMPVRGPAIGTVRTGWRTRELDAWIDPAGASPTASDAAAIQRRIEQEVLLLPLARSGTSWVVRAERNVARFGRDGLPDFGNAARTAAGRPRVNR